MIEQNRNGQGYQFWDGFQTGLEIAMSIVLDGNSLEEIKNKIGVDLNDVRGMRISMIGHAITFKE